MFERAEDEEEIKESRSASFNTGVKGCTSLTSTLSTSADYSLGKLNEKPATFTPSTF